MALPHSGNWDMAGVWLVQHYGTFTTVAERLKPESLYRRFVDYRESLGFEIVPLTGGERPPFEVLADRLRENRFVCLMAERDLTRRGVEVDFFGEPTRMPAGPAKLAIETGAALLPGALLLHPRQLGDRHLRRHWTPFGRRPAITQALADVFAGTIAAHPADWHMLQPQWIADLTDGDARGSPAGQPPRPATRDRDDRRPVPDAHRHGVPVLLRRSRRRAGPRVATGRGDAGARPLRQRACAVVAARRHCPTTSSPAARPSRSRTTARSRGCASAPPRTARSRGGSPTASSTCCTCTSPTRRACRCWR